MATPLTWRLSGLHHDMPQGHNKIITAMEAKGNLLYTGGYDNCVKVWDVPAKKLIASGTTVSPGFRHQMVLDLGSPKSR